MTGGLHRGLRSPKIAALSPATEPEQLDRWRISRCSSRLLANDSLYPLVSHFD